MFKIADLGPEELSAGVSPATKNSMTPLWKDASNVVFREGAIRPEPGQAVLFQKQIDEPVLGFGEVERGGRPILYYGTKTKLYRGDRVASPAITDISDIAYNCRLDGTEEHPPTRVSIEAWGEWGVFANGIDELRIHKPSNATAHPPGHANVFGAAYKRPLEHEAAGVAFKPSFLVRARGHMLAFCHHVHASVTTDNEIAEGEQTGWWCDQNNLAKWFPEPGSLAGSIPIRDLGGPIRAAVGMLDGAGVYSENTLVLFQYIGAPLVFGTVRTLAGVGAFGQHSVVAAGRIHYGAGPRGLWRTDGTEFQYIDHPAVRDWFLSRLTRSQRGKVVAWHNTTLGRVVWFFAADGSLTWNAAIGFDYEQDTIHIPGYVRTAATNQEVFPFPITADLDGNIWEQSVVDGSAAAPGSPLTLSAEYSFDGGYGGGGYGVWGYGGEESGVG